MSIQDDVEWRAPAREYWVGRIDQAFEIIAVEHLWMLVRECESGKAL